MKKIKLNLNDLKIESFETTTQTENKGTVAGNAINTYNYCNESKDIACPYTQGCFKTFVEPECFIITKGNCQSVAVICNTLDCQIETFDHNDFNN